MKKGILLLLFIAGFSWNAMAYNTHCDVTVRTVVAYNTHSRIGVTTANGTDVTYLLADFTNHSAGYISSSTAIALTAKNMGKELKVVFLGTHDCNLTYITNYPMLVSVQE